ncbi:hypothetical protein HDU99_010873, partial [Rhizoclosmatium hyalinum]
MLVTEYVGLYVYQIMLKVLVYSIKLKFEFYILTVLETNIRLSVGPGELDSAVMRARENAKAAEARLSAMDISGTGNAGASILSEERDGKPSTLLSMNSR